MARVLGTEHLDYERRFGDSRLEMRERVLEELRRGKKAHMRHDDSVELRKSTLESVLRVLESSSSPEESRGGHEAHAQ